MGHGKWLWNLLWMKLDFYLWNPRGKGGLVVDYMVIQWILHYIWIEDEIRYTVDSRQASKAHKKVDFRNFLLSNGLYRPTGLPGVLSFHSLTSHAPREPGNRSPTRQGTFWLSLTSLCRSQACFWLSFTRSRPWPWTSGSRLLTLPLFLTPKKRPRRPPGLLDCLSFPLDAPDDLFRDLWPQSTSNVLPTPLVTLKCPQNLHKSGGLYLTQKFDTMTLFFFSKLPFWRQNSKFRSRFKPKVEKGQKKGFFTVVFLSVVCSLAKGSGVRFLMRHVVPSRANFP